MALPLAHPAAVLPLRRWCPRWFSFPALVAGSLSPDLAYLFGPLELDRVAHRPLGAVVSGLFLGGALLLAWRLLAHRVFRCLPETPGTMLTAHSRVSPGTFPSVLVSLAIGALTHWFVDAVTHKDGAIAAQVPWLQLEIMRVGYKTVRVCQVLWHASSLAGVVWLTLAFQVWWQQTSHGMALVSARTRWVHALALGVSIAPLAVAHHLFAPQHIQIAVGLLMAAITAAVAWRVMRLP